MENITAIAYFFFLMYSIVFCVNPFYYHQLLLVWIRNDECTYTHFWTWPKELTCMTPYFSPQKVLQWRGCCSWRCWLALCWLQQRNVRHQICTYKLYLINHQKAWRIYQLRDETILNQVVCITISGYVYIYTYIYIYVYYSY